MPKLTWKDFQVAKPSRWRKAIDVAMGVILLISLYIIMCMVLAI